MDDIVFKISIKVTKNNLFIFGLGFSVLSAFAFILYEPSMYLVAIGLMIAGSSIYDYDDRAIGYLGAILIIIGLVIIALYPIINFGPVAPSIPTPMPPETINA